MDLAPLSTTVSLGPEPRMRPLTCSNSRSDASSCPGTISVNISDMTFVFPRTMSSSLRSLAICWAQRREAGGRGRSPCLAGTPPSLDTGRTSEGVQQQQVLSPSGLESTGGGGGPPESPGRQHWAKRALWDQRTKLVCSLHFPALGQGLTLRPLPLLFQGKGGACGPQSLQHWNPC